jgi:serine/threonine protein kinase
VNLQDFFGAKFIQVEQLHKIFKLCGSPSEEFWANLKLSRATIFKPQHPYRRSLNDVYKDFPPAALSLLDRLLAVEPGNRGTAASALESEVSTHLCILLACISVVTCAVNWPLQIFVYMSGVIPTLRLSYKTMLPTTLLLVSGMLIKLHLAFVLHVNLAFLCFSHFYCWAQRFPYFPCLE